MLREDLVLSFILFMQIGQNGEGLVIVVMDGDYVISVVVLFVVLMKIVEILYLAINKIEFQDLAKLFFMRTMLEDI